MISIIIPAIKSLTITNKYPDKSLNEDVITVGSDGKYKYYSYLFFDISSIPCDVIVSNAELVLFKVDNFYNDTSKKVSISPLDEYFSTYTTYNTPPAYDHYTTVNFYPLTSKIAVTVNITTIISSWVKDKPNNKGIVLYEKNKDAIINFGSVKSDDNYLAPFIIVNYEHYPLNKSSKEECAEKYIKICKEELEEILIKFSKEICKNTLNPQPTPHPIPTPTVTVRQVRVTGIVAPLSLYCIIVNFEVTRASSGQKDNYYVSDEYDNFLNNNSLSIDKTYNIAIIPEIQPGDTENVTLYGSYKDPISNMDIGQYSRDKNSNFSVLYF